MAPVLVYFIIRGNPGLFKWFLAISFFTDVIDGYLARKHKVTSILGAHLDSIGDDLTILAAVVGMFVFKLEFIKSELILVGILLFLFLVQNVLAFIRYKKVTSFHTYITKTAAVFQGVFIILLFFLPEPVYPLFYVTAVITALALIEEIIIVLVLPGWEANVKGLYWVIKK